MSIRGNFSLVRPITPTRRGLSAALGLALAFALLACGGGSTNGTTASHDPYQIGGTWGLTGGLAYVYVPMNEGTAAYFNYINKNGGVNGHPINYTVLDDQASPPVSIANVKQLQTQGVIAIMTSNSSAVTAMLPTATAGKTPVVTIASGSNFLVPVQPYFFASYTILDGQAKPLVSFAKEQIKTSSPKVAILGGGSTGIKALVKSLGTEATGKGLTVVANEDPGLTATDLSPQVGSIVAKQPDIIFTMIGPNALPAAVKYSRQIGYTGLWVTYTGSYSPPVWQQINDPNVYALVGSTTGVGSGPEVKIMQDASKLAGTSYTQYQWIPGYLTGWITVRGLEKCGFPCSGEKLQKALEGLGTLTQARLGGIVPGTWTYNMQTHIGPTSVNVVHYQNSQLTPVGTGYEVSPP
jgi:branched-chain amino acid transport system substrate-binding protein